MTQLLLLDLCVINMTQLLLLDFYILFYNMYTNITPVLGNVSHPKLFFFKCVWLFQSMLSQLWNYWHFAPDNSWLYRMSWSSQDVQQHFWLLPYRVQLNITCSFAVTQSCPTHCDRMYCSMPDFLVLHVSWSLLKLTAIELVMPSNHRILCCSLLLLPSIFPSIRVFSMNWFFASGGQILELQLFFFFFYQVFFF